MSDYILIYITISNEEAATHIAEKLVSENLVACANIIPTIKSVYKWQNQMETNSESVVLFKTTKSMEQIVINRIKELHPYQLPCVVSFDIADGNGDFLNWISQSVMESKHESK